MTEGQWLTCTNPTAMLDFLRDDGRASDRKLRLFGVACCRRAWHLLADGRGRRAVEVTEAFADGRGTETDLKAARLAAWTPEDAGTTQAGGTTWRSAGLAAVYAADERGETAARACEPAAAAMGFGMELASQSSLLRDIFGPLPFRPLTIDPTILAWRDATVVRLAQAAYDNRKLPAGTLEQERLMVLADALEEAGDQHQEVLRHLREQKEHWRGCWVLDLLLAKG